MASPATVKLTELAKREIDAKYTEMKRALGPLGKPEGDMVLQSVRSANLEAILRLHPRRLSGGTGNVLAFNFFDAKTLTWRGPFPIIADGTPITGVTGNPVLIQGTFGRQGNFEMLVPQGDRLMHYFRDNDTRDFAWHAAGGLPTIEPSQGPHGLAGIPVGVTLIQGNFGSPGNFEAVVRMRPNLLSVRTHSLFFYFFDSTPKRWHGPFPMVAEGKPITDVSGDPVLIQSTFGRHGNFELLVPQGDKLMHYFRDNDAPDKPWKFVTELPAVSGETLVGATFVQGNFGSPGNLEAVVRVRSGATPSVDTLAFYLFDASKLQWQGPFPLLPDGAPVTGVTGDPVLVQSTFGRQGNFELLVPQGDRLRHFFRDNDAAGFPWHAGPDLPTSEPADGVGGPSPIGVSFIQGNFGRELRFMQTYHGGRITWNNHTGASAKTSHETQILYKGMHCFGTTNGPGSDEPYAVVSVFSPGSEDMVRTFTFGPHNGVDAGEDIPEIKEIWRGSTVDVVIKTVVMEHDHGDPDRIRDGIQQALKKAADAAAAAAEVPTPEEWIDDLTLGIADFLTSLLGLGDDVVGQDGFLIRKSEFKEFTEPKHAPFIKFKRIEYNYPRDDANRPPVSDEDASYKVYFEVRTREVPDF